jgi:hypothetical protein
LRHELLQGRIGADLRDQVAQLIADLRLRSNAGRALVQAQGLKHT